MAQTKATRIFKRLLDNDFAPSVFLAIIHNDEDAFQIALDKANVSEDDLTLPKDEFNSFAKGLEPSGELDLWLWEGYYVVTSPSQSDPHALLILAGAEKVYWGTQSQVLGDLDNHVVDHHITPDNKLQFSSQSDGLVSISLSREHDKESDTPTAKFTGTLGGKEVSGVKAPPPIEGPSLQQKSFNLIRAELSLATWYEDPVVASISTLSGLLGGGVALYQVYLWIREKFSRTQASTELARETETRRTSLHEVATRTTPDPVVTYLNAGRFVDIAITTSVNQNLQDNPPDYTQDSNVITRGLTQSAESAAMNALRRYITDRAGPQLRESLEKFSIVSDFETLLREINDRFVENSAAEMMRRLSPLDPAVHPLVLEAREQHFANDFTSKETSLGAKETEFQEIREKREKLQRDINESKRAIDELEREGKVDEAQREQERKGELERDEREAGEKEQEKERERDQAKQEKDAAHGLKESSERETREDQSKDEWEERKNGAFEKK